MSKSQQLQIRAAALPEAIAAEVLDFLEFVAAKRAQERKQSPARTANANPRSVALTPVKLPTFKGGPILADPRTMKQHLYANHE